MPLKAGVGAALHLALAPGLRKVWGVQVWRIPVSAPGEWEASLAQVAGTLPLKV